MTSAVSLQSPQDSFVDELKPGTQLMHGQYTIKRFLNSGGFGITYLATDSLDRTVVIKECFPGAFCHRSNMLVQARSRNAQDELRSIVRLFTQEARALAKLKHPNIVGVHQVFEDNNTAYMALDFVKGRDLYSIIEAGNIRLAPVEVRSLLEKLLDAIKFVHAEGLLHRDISPDNIIVTDAMEPVLIDFGAAREQASRATRALSALRVVKDGYSPQEFYIAGREQGPSSDLYSLAATFYHLITGDVPPDSQLRIAAHVAGEQDPYIPLSRRTQAFDAAFCAALDRAMAILPKDRVQNAKEWQALMSGKGVAAVATPAPVIQPKRVQPQTAARAKTAKKSLKPVMAGAAVALVLLGGGAAYVAAPGTLAGIAGPGAGEVQAAAAPDAEPKAVIAAQAAVPAAPSASANDGGIAAAAAPAARAAAEPVEGAATAALDARQGVVEAGVLTSGWTVEMPFTVAADDPVRIETVSAGAPGAILPGQRILSVNGEPVDGVDAAVAVARAGQLSPDGRSTPILLTVENAGGGSPVAHKVTLPVVYETSLANGFSLHTRFEDGAWVTRIAAVPAAYAEGLREGDVLIALLPSKESFDNVVNLRTVLVREIEAGRTTLRVAVRRDGSMWVENMNIGAVAG